MTIDKILQQLEAMGQQPDPVIPDWVTDPIDREMLRLGRATVQRAKGYWIGEDGPALVVVDNGHTPEHRAANAARRAQIAHGLAMEAEGRERARLERNAKLGGNRSAAMHQAVEMSLGLQAKGMKAGAARAKAGAAFGLNPRSVARSERAQKDG